MKYKDFDETIRLFNVVLGSCLSQKASILADKYQCKQFVFIVLKSATKPMIKKAVQMLFNVKVTDVRVLNVKGKVKTFKRTLGKRKDWKKAYVTLQAGHDIDFTDVKLSQSI